MRIFVLTLSALLLAPSFRAEAQQASPIGQWRTIDDHSGKPRSIVEVFANPDGTLSARIVRLLDLSKGPNPMCDACRGALHGKPVVGMTLLSNVKKVEGKEVWEGGKILDPENGKTYSVRLTPIEGGKKLEVRGSIGPFWRTQTWVRMQ